MKVLFAIRSPGFIRFFEPTIRELGADGHTIEVVCHYYRQAALETLKEIDRAAHETLQTFEAELPGFRWGPALRRNDRWRRPLFAARKLLDYSSYLTPGRQASRMVVDRTQGYLPAQVRHALRFRPLHALLGQPGLHSALRQFERIVPPDTAITAWLQHNRPDVVVASPVLMPASDEVEYVKAAERLGIPTLVAVMSWDNLTSKGTLHVIPDITAVWNQAQAEEAVQLHSVPQDKVVYTGAPVFDEWFQMQPTLDRAGFCRQAGLDPARPYVLYLCSSRSIAQDEKPFIEEVARGLRQHAGTGELNLLVRPHPSNAGIWQGYSDDLIKLWPPAGALPATAEARQDFYHSLHFGIGALGINTSALIETAIVDRPCITILAGRYRDTQTEIAHFRHLLNADFLEVAADLPALAETLTGILRGRDARQAQRRRFVQEFVRPWGLSQPASRIMAVIIEAVGQRWDLAQMRAWLVAGRDAATVPAGTLTAAPARAASLA
jgi:hypothetical protein